MKLKLKPKSEPKQKQKFSIKQRLLTNGYYNGKTLTLSGRKAVTGLIFVLPLILGFIFLFAVPMFNSFMYSVGEIELKPDGFSFKFTGFQNYKNIFFEHTTFLRSFTTTLKDVALEVPLILVFSFFIAVLLNQKFKGRMWVRALFFLPVIVSCGVVMRLDNQAYVESHVFHGGSGSGTVMSNMLGGIQLAEYLQDLGIAPELITYLTTALDGIYDIINASGVQILLLLSALQTIPESLFEASSIEGATAWENFWKITFPMLSPYILVTTFYTIIDSFMMTGNETYNMTKLIETTVNEKLNFAVASAMSWVYLVAIALIIAVVCFIISRYVSYTE